jgi:rfaE bifunctional protein nucleotidyltransferase chain/domain
MKAQEMNRDPKNLIMSLEEALKWRARLKNEKRKLVITNGCFDILHRGHAEYLMEARMLGDAMLILINSDQSVRELKGPTRPIIDEYNRAYMLAALESVDAVVTFNTPRCTEMFLALQPDIYVKGGDYTLDTINKEEKQALLEVEAEIIFKPFIEGFSTTDIVNRIKQDNGC